MTSEDVFAGARTALTFHSADLNAVAEEIGMERVVALQTKMCESMGSTIGEMMKGQEDSEEFHAKAAWSLVRSFKDCLGSSYEVSEEGPQRVVVKNGRCPIYEAARMVGMDADTIETGCRAGPIRLMDAVAKQLNPNLNLRVAKFRSSPDDFCAEEIVLG
jgi:hypothetical protein